MFSSLPYGRTSVSLAALVSMLALSACDQPPTPTQPTTAKQAPTSTPSKIREAERHLHELAREHPGFGGLFIDDDGVVVAYMTDPARGNVIRGKIEGLVSAGSMGSQGHQVAIRKGEFDFPSLAYWRDIVSEQLLGVMPGVVMSDADEAANRVTIGIDEAIDPEVKAKVVRTLVRAGVPVNAINFIAARAASADVGPSRLESAVTTMLPNQDVRGVPLPVVSGYRLRLPSYAYPCTIGPVVLHNGAPALVTGSHCTSATYAFDGSGSLFRTDDFTVIGQEGLDPGATCGSNCRRSDAALIYLNSGVSYDYGRIARTTNVSHTWGVAGSTSVNQTYPTRDVIGVLGLSDVTQGMSLVKTGQTTGSTSGLVSNACVDILANDNYWRKCSIASSYYADDSDSGSPVYTYDNFGGTGGVFLVGIHWGNNGSNTSFSSYFDWVTSEIGGTFVAARPFPLTGYILGFSDVDNDAMCQLRYEAVGMGGTAPYTYTWSTDGVIKQQDENVVILAFPDYPGAGDARFVDVTITDAVNAIVTKGFPVTAYSSNENCFTI